MIVCERLTDDVPFELIGLEVLKLYDRADQQQDVGYLIGEGVRNICPENKSKIVLPGK